MGLDNCFNKKSRGKITAGSDFICVCGLLIFRSPNLSQA